MNSSVERRTGCAATASADIVQAGPAPDSLSAELPAREPSQEPAEDRPLRRAARKAAAGKPDRGRLRPADFVIETGSRRLPNCLSRSLPRLHTQPIWKRRGNPTELPEIAGGNAEERLAVPPARRCETAVADAGGKQRLQRTGAAIVGAARERDGQRACAVRHRHRSKPSSRRPQRSRRETKPASEPPAAAQPEWLAPPRPPARGEARRDKALLDLLPVGVLIYRLDRLLYANPAFLDADGLCQPARAGGCRRARRALCRARRLERLQHVGHRHAGDDFRKPAARPGCKNRKCARRRRRRPMRASTRFPGTANPRSP